MTHFIAQWESGVYVRWRALTWAEYNSFRNQIETRPGNVTLDIYRACLVDGPDEDRVPAGIADFIARHVMEVPFSGDYKSIKTALDEGRQLNRQYLHSAKALICHLLHYKLEEIEKWTSDVFFERLAMCEIITGKPFEPADPAAKTKQSEDGPVRKKKPLNAAQQMAIDRKYGKA